MNFGHQLPNNVSVTGWKLMNISNGSILLTASRLQSSDLKTQVSFSDLTADEISTGSFSFIEVEEGGILYISGSQFFNINSLSVGGVLTAGYRKSITEIRDSVFQNNSAIHGGVLTVKDQSVIKCYNWTFTNNFGITSGVANVGSNGYFEFYDSFIHHNYAQNNPVSQLFDTSFISIISNWEIHHNEAFSKASLVAEFNTDCSKLWFLKPIYKDFVTNNIGIAENGVASIFQLISASLAVSENSQVHSQTSIAKAFLSTLSFENSTISGIDLQEKGLEIVGSTLNLANTKIFGITNDLKLDFILAVLDSHLVFTNLEYSNSSSVLFTSTSSKMTINQLNFQNIINSDKMFELFEAYNSSINGIVSDSFQGEGRQLISISKSQNIALGDFEISNSPNIVLEIKNSQINSMEDIRISNWGEALSCLLYTSPQNPKTPKPHLNFKGMKSEL